MAKRINFFDQASSSTTPVINSIQAADLSKYANDAAYQAANVGSPIGGNIYYNTTTDKVRYYDDATASWTNVLDSSLLGVASGIASLDGAGKVPSSQLPSYVDDVEEYANLAAFPITGETGKIYVAIDTAFTYRWTGSIYVQLSASPVASVNGQTGAVVLDLDDINDVTETATAAREFLRRNTGNTAWENFNIDSSADDAATGANQTLTLPATSVVRLTNASLTSIDMVPAGFSGQKFILINATGVALDVNNETGGTAANRILTGTGADLNLEADANLWFTYDATTARWRVVGGSGAGAVLTANRAVATDGGGGLVASTTTDTELGYVSGVTSAIQTQLNGKEPSFSTLPISKGGTNSNTALSNNRVIQSSGGSMVEAAAITGNRALASDANGIPVAIATTDTELGYVSGVTSAIQTQLNARVEKSLVTAKGDLYGASASATPVRVPVGANGTFLKADSTTSEGVTYSTVVQVFSTRTVTTTDTPTTSDDVILADATGGAFTITLFTAVGNSGKRLVIQKIDSSTNIITIDGNSSETINGFTTQVLGRRYDSITIVADNGNWTVIETTGSRTAYIKDVKSSGSTGGSVSAGSYTARVLNTLSGDTSFVSLSSNQITLQPGTYKFKASCPAFFCGVHKAKLRNITDSTDTIIGQSATGNAASGNVPDSQSIIMDTFSITAAKTFEVQHRAASTGGGTSGFGVATTFGDSEVFTVVEIEKVL